MGFAYTIFIGIPLCIVLVGVGLLLCLTILGIPVGLTLVALGFTYVTLPNRRFL
jgi:uncharacterized membrane protein YccF (DUF307 family)